MPFQNGNKLSPGGKKGNKGGRPRKDQLEIHKEAAEIAKQYLEKHINPFLESYRQLVAGRDVKHFNQKTGEHIYTDFEVDAASVRHAIDKFVPPIEKVEHSGEVGVRPWTMDAYEPKKKEKK